MNRQFQDFDGKKISDATDYVKEYTKNSSDFEIYVGTDSQVYGNYTKFVTAICMYDGDRGAHVIYHPNKVYRDERELFNRLWEEAQMTMEVAASLTEKLGRDQVITHFDVNPSDQYRSNIAHKATVGLAESGGFRFRVKPNAWAATCAADHLN